MRERRIVAMLAEASETLFPRWRMKAYQVLLPYCPVALISRARRRGTVVVVPDAAMAPTLAEGAAIVVTPFSRRWKPGRVYAVRTGKGLLVGRAALSSDGQRIIQSDNPEWPDLPLPRDAEIIGEVLYVARGLD